MRSRPSFLVPCAALALFLAPTDGRAQDRVTLKNGDVLTGRIKTLAAGTLTIENASLGDVEVPMAQVENLTTEEPVELLTNQGERLRRRIAGIEAGELKLARGPEGALEMPAISLDNLQMINPPEEIPPEWNGSFKLIGLLTTGNTDRRSIGASIEAERRGEVDRITFDAAWDYAEDKQETLGWNLNARRAGAGLKYDYFLDDRWYTLATTRVFGDTLADISLRFTAGLGIGHQVLESEETELLVELGLSYFNENYRSATPSIDYLAARVAYKLQQQLSEHTRLLHGVEGYPSLENADDVYFRMVTELQTHMTESMIGSLAWTWDYDNTPSPGRDRNDHQVVLSIGWTF